MDAATLPSDRNTAGHRFEIRFPETDPDERDQHEEWCEVTIDGRERRIRFHDYDEIFAIPGLYEQLFYEKLRCQSPRVVREMLAGCLEEAQDEPSDLRVLDVGAGNGIVGEELRSLGVESITGVDIIEAAAQAARRDRPEVYDDYLVLDLTEIDDREHEALSAGQFNCMVSVAALGFGDIPPEAFAGGYRYLASGGLVAISLKAGFLADGEDASGFAQMVGAAIEDGSIEVRSERQYQHRLSASGEAIDYVAIIAEKRADLPLLAAGRGSRLLEAAAAAQ